jgi:hypothetical protein
MKKRINKNIKKEILNIFKKLEKNNIFIFLKKRNIFFKIILSIILIGFSIIAYIIPFIPFATFFLIF